jgi:hypothetical protein
MFTMMNNARLNVGIQGVAIAEAAYQHALAYARERKQGRAQGAAGTGMSPIADHPDVQRNLLTMKSHIVAARAICHACAHAIDRSHSPGPDARAWAERASLITPVAKAFSTDVGVEVASIGVQIHGGMGFIEETGAAQFLRDARINPIYEGTNGIQAIDLVTRKLPLSGGETFASWIGELRVVADQVRASNREGFGATAARLNEALDAAETAARWLLDAQAQGRTNDALAGATPFLRLVALAAGGAFLARAGLADADAGRVALARFFAENHLGECAALKSRATEGAASLAAAAPFLQSA